VIVKTAARVGGTRFAHFLLVVADHQRTHVLPEMIAAFQEVMRERKGSRRRRFLPQWR